jgi:hypothetical protein
MSELFHSADLIALYKKGDLDHVLRKFKKEIHKDNLIGGGGDASVFSYNGGKQVLKICRKNIRYFKKCEDKKAKYFKDHINTLTPYFLSVDDILYEDNNVFVYTQPKCKLMKTKDINHNMVIDIFELVKFMLERNIIMTDLAPHNMGIHNGHVVTFDYHGLHPLKKDGYKIKRKNWWRRVARNLTRFMCYIYASGKRRFYANMMQDCNDKVIGKFRESNSLPACFADLLEYFNTKHNEASTDHVCELLQKCITQIERDGQKIQEKLGKRAENFQDKFREKD